MITLVSDSEKLPDSLFRPETYPYQASWDEWGRGYTAGARGATAKSAPDVLVMRAASRTQAMAALKAIAEQGEAVDVSQATEDSHFRRFLQVYREFSKSSLPAILPVATDPRAPGLGAGDGGSVISNPQAVGWAGLFNLRYRMLLAWLAHAFQLSDDPAQTDAPGRRGQVLNRVFAEMYNLKTIAGLLVRPPLAEDPGQRAGPPFQMPYSLNYPADEVDFWRLHLDLVEASDAQRSALPTTDTAGLAYARALGEADRLTRLEIEAILSRDNAPAQYLRSMRSGR
jgi:hypothetical protein